MARALISGSMGLSTKENGPSIKSAVEASTGGRTAGSTMVNGGTITCMDAEFTPGLTVVDMKATTRTIRNTDRELSLIHI